MERDLHSRTAHRRWFARGPAAIAVLSLVALSGGAARAVSNGIKDSPPGLVELQYRRGETWDDAHECGGSLIGRHWVVTAAHCIHDARPDWDVRSDVRVRIGVATLDRHAETLARIVFASDPGFAPGSDPTKPPENDIALLRIEPGADLDADDVDIVRLPPAIDFSAVDDRKGQQAWVSGWGQTSQDSTSMSLAANSNRMEIISNHSCEEQLNAALEANGANGDISLGPGMFCAQDPRDKAVEHAGGADALGIEKDWVSTGHCEGDSGGPLTRDAEDGADMLVGVVSWGLTNADAGLGCGDGLPDVFANVPMWVGWINREIAAYQAAHPDAEADQDDDD